ncbi:MAG: hypothetical protein H0T78_03050, partial [Longispora sp.]|nr:hypothetical protein [Longispora sp. (in: high G+C Gram-positive bacteria)]
DAVDVGVLLAQIHQAGRGAPDGLVGTHTDLDPKNALRDVDGAMMAVDWDAAGLMRPSEEVVQVALDWSLEADHVDEVRFATVVASYRDADGPGRLSADKDLFTGWLRAYQNWLEFNVSQRMDTALGRREAATTQARITLVTSVLDDLVNLLDAP